jgi:hypothetical protein
MAAQWIALQRLGEGLGWKSAPPNCEYTTTSSASAAASSSSVYLPFFPVGGFKAVFFFSGPCSTLMILAFCGPARRRG